MVQYFLEIDRTISVAVVLSVMECGVRFLHVDCWRQRYFAGSGLDWDNGSCTGTSTQQR